LKHLYHILRFLAVTVIILTVLLPAILYVGLSLDSVQSRISAVAEKELSSLLGSEVTIGKVNIAPFNRVTLRDVAVQPAPGDTALQVSRLGAGIDLWDLVFRDHITVNYVELISMDARVWRDSADSPLNIQPVIDALAPKEPGKPPTKFDLRLNTLIIRSSRASYDVRTAPRKDRFDPSHVQVSNLRADIRCPGLKNDDYTVEVKRLALDAAPGFQLKNLQGFFHLDNRNLDIRGLAIELPNSNLALEDIHLPLTGIKDIARAVIRGTLRVTLKPGSSLYLPDLAPFLPLLDGLPFHTTVNTMEAEGNASDADLRLDLDLGGAARISVNARGQRLDSPNPELILSDFALVADGNRVADLMEGNGDRIPTAAPLWFRRAGSLKIEADASIGRNAIDASARVVTTPGSVDLSARAEISPRGMIEGEASVSTVEPLHLDLLTGNDLFGEADGAVSATFSGPYKNLRQLSGTVEAEVTRMDFRGVSYTDLAANAEFSPGSVSGAIMIDNTAVGADLTGEFTRTPGHNVIAVDGHVRCPDFGIFLPAMSGNGVESDLAVDLAGSDYNTMEGSASLTGTKIHLRGGKTLPVDNLTLVSALREDGLLRVDLTSDYLSGFILGEFDFRNIAREVKALVATAYPAILPYPAVQEPGVSDFIYDFTIQPTEELASIFSLPVSIVYPATLRGSFNGRDLSAALNLSVPYLRQGSKLIENTALNLNVSEGAAASNLDFTTQAPTKNGPMTFRLLCEGAENRLTSQIDWSIERARAYEGTVRAATTFSRPVGSAGPEARIDLLPGELTFNDSTWTINPAIITVAGKEVGISGINVHHGRQFVKIDGAVSPDPDKRLTLDLADFSLDYLFESLGIDKVMLGGDASGTFYASRLYTSSPSLETATDGLRVKDISYNKTVMGDAVVRSAWDGDRRAITLDADIDRLGHRATVQGAIFPMNDSLDITFNADHTPVGFMAPYMEAFASDISGYASGRARLWGNFKYIDLEGDVYADSLRLKVNFTNTYYTASDSVHFSPGLIDLNGITIRDAEGHTASLNGWVRHKFFKEPRFDFALTNARNFLCYNETPRENPIWYGKVYGNGSAFVSGEPGVVNINVDIATAPRSTFTLVLSDQEVAEQYSFLTFRDKNHISAELTDSLTLRHDTSMDLVNRLRALAASHGDEDTPSDYNITIQTRVTPEAEIVLVMDPVGGDRIRANGSGSLRLDYGSANNDLKMYGTYTLDRGRYNFTLQDIIIKDFTIKPGSEITFRGDPYAAQLDIKAAYSLNANLSDLDESFLHDKDLNRTSVPVNAIMNVSGDMRQPEISFDLEFPTLNADVYRKVRSIVSTDDMMNRQIIYLLALNRFYTPEYMASATRGNELVSVASSTISSQLQNILGSISNNWSVAPSFRSDRGDFSDVEVDLALSSRLLNNRLLFNGNFGYRDKSMNANQFVGDFDLEYLLNRQGTLRLKAYNRYNDQNYYLRQALTTQGVGVAIRKDFDSLTSFLRPVFRFFHKNKNKEKADTTAIPHPVAVPVSEPSGNDNPASSPDDNLLQFRNASEKNTGMNP